jgi:transposase InsO family protein
VVCFIDLMRGRGCRVESICRVLRDYGVKIAARTYRAAKRRAPSARDVSDAHLVEQMRRLRQTPDARGALPRERFYGRRKMTRLLAREGITAGEERVGRLMRQEKMRGLVRGRRVKTTVRAGARPPGSRDLLNRNFTAPAPNRRWVTDLTYVRTASGWVYVTFMTDLFSHKIVAWSAAATMTAKMVSQTLKLAIWARKAEGHPVGAGKLIHHSDHGSQYTSVHYGEQLAHAGITPSFGSIGDALDNALAESINGLYKAECVEQDGPFRDLGDVELATAGWVGWYNKDRLHSALDYATPNQYEQTHYDHS